MTRKDKLILLAIIAVLALVAAHAFVSVDAVRGGRKVVDGISVLGEAHLVPFKAKAFLDLRERRARGEHVDGKDLRKHKNDVFRLLQLFTPGTAAPLPDSVRDDMARFCDIVSEEGVPLRQIGVRMTLDEALGQIARSYGL